MAHVCVSDRGTDHVPSWLGATVILVSVCLVALGLFAADHAGQPASSTTSTFVPSDGHTSYARQLSRAAGRETVTTRVYRVGDAVSLLVESGPSLSYAYTPNLVELPMGAAPGASWQSEGTARVMLMLANVILAIAILAYTCLVRDPSATVNLDAFATLGDEVLGTALMAAAFVAVLSAVRQERAIDWALGPRAGPADSTTRSNSSTVRTTPK
jgi:hypothetical protein